MIRMRSGSACVTLLLAGLLWCCAAEAHLLNMTRVTVVLAQLQAGFDVRVDGVPLQSTFTAASFPPADRRPTRKR